MLLLLLLLLLMVVAASSRRRPISVSVHFSRCCRRRRRGGVALEKIEKTLVQFSNINVKKANDIQAQKLQIAASFFWRRLGNERAGTCCMQQNWVADNLCFQLIQFLQLYVPAYTIRLIQPD